MEGSLSARHAADDGQAEAAQREPHARQLEGFVVQVDGGATLAVFSDGRGGGLLGRLMCCHVDINPSTLPEMMLT